MSQLCAHNFQTCPSSGYRNKFYLQSDDWNKERVSKAAVSYCPTPVSSVSNKPGALPLSKVEARVWKGLDGLRLELSQEFWLKVFPGGSLGESLSSFWSLLYLPPEYPFFKSDCSVFHTSFVSKTRLVQGQTSTWLVPVRTWTWLVCFLGDLRPHRFIQILLRESSEGHEIKELVPKIQHSLFIAWYTMVQ